MWSDFVEGYYVMVLINMQSINCVRLLVKVKNICIALIPKPRSQVDNKLKVAYGKNIM